MILYSVSYHAQFNSKEDITFVENKHNIKIMNVTNFEVELCKTKNEIYRGPEVYLFIGDWPNLIKYFLYDYYLEDIEQLKELIESIKTIEI